MCARLPESNRDVNVSENVRRQVGLCLGKPVNNLPIALERLYHEHSLGDSVLRAYPCGSGLTIRAHLKRLRGERA